MGERVYRGRATKPCEGCGKPVTRKASAFKAHTFCQRSCYLASDYHREATRASNARWHPARVEAACLNCGKTVSRPPSQMNTRTFCSVECRWEASKVAPARQVTSGGYVKVFIGRGLPGATKTGHIFEHRLVMQQHLRRTLLASENVHHVNGQRADNRLENLELWSTSQPCGQRVEDKLAWARQFIETYDALRT